MYKTAVIVIEKYAVRHNLLVTLIRLEQATEACTVSRKAYYVEQSCHW